MASESAFEYDEDIEAADEAFEAADEADEAADEADEAADEADEAADEAFEAADEADEAADEADEAADEADEALDEVADEALDEGISLSAQLRLNQAKARRAAFARKIAARQRIEAAKATAMQRDVNERMRLIRARNGVARIRQVGRLQGAGVVDAVLPNGRRTKMRIIPTLAPVKEVNSLRAVINANEKRQAAASVANARAIAALGAAQAATVKKLTDQQIAGDRELGKRIVEGHSSLDKRITSELNNRKTEVGKNQKKIARMVRRAKKAALWDSLLLATSAPLFAAYGDRRNPFSRNNLILTGSLAGFLAGDHVIEWATRRSRMRAFGSTVASAWSYLAPIANGALAYWLLDDKIHDRFLSNVSSVKIEGEGTGSADVPLTIPAGSRAEFLARLSSTNPPAAVGTVVDGVGTVCAQIVKVGEQPTLKLTVSGSPKQGALQVAWIVELQAQTKAISDN